MKEKNLRSWVWKFGTLVRETSQWVQGKIASIDQIEQPGTAVRDRASRIR